MAAIGPSSWKSDAQQLSELLQTGGGNEAKIVELFGVLNSLVYPVENLRSEVKPTAAAELIDTCTKF